MKPVQGIGSIPNSILILSDFITNQDITNHQPLSGKVGDEMDWQYWNLMGLSPDNVRIESVYDYIVPFKPNDREKHVNKTWDIQSKKAIEKISKVKPDLIIAMGNVSNRLFFTDVDMTRIHGIPHYIHVGSLYGEYTNYTHSPVIIPMTHPSVGLGSTEKIRDIRFDATQVKLWLDGKISVWKPIRPSPLYQIWDNHEIPDSYKYPKIPIAIDTEWCRNGVWCVQWSMSPHSGWLVWKKDIHRFKELIENRLVIVHNASYDINNLNKLGIYPEYYIDTMWMADKLGLPQGLKILAYRYLNLIMNSYTETVYPATQSKMMTYLDRIMNTEWDDPKPVKEWNPSPKYEYSKTQEYVPCTKNKKDRIECPCGGTVICPYCDGKGYYYVREKRGDKFIVSGTENGHYHYRQPQNIRKRCEKLMNKSGTVDLYDKWIKMEGIDQVERAIGKAAQGELCDIKLDDAVYYGCQDADATLRLFWILGELIMKNDMGHLLRDDIRKLFR